MLLFFSADFAGDGGTVVSPAAESLSDVVADGVSTTPRALANSAEKMATGSESAAEMGEVALRASTSEGVVGRAIDDEHVGALRAEGGLLAGEGARADDAAAGRVLCTIGTACDR